MFHPQKGKGSGANLVISTLPNNLAPAAIFFCATVSVCRTEGPCPFGETAILLKHMIHDNRQPLGRMTRHTRCDILSHSSVQCAFLPDDE